MIICPSCLTIQSDEYVQKISETDVDLEHCTCEQCHSPLDQVTSVEDFLIYMASS